MTKQMKRTKQPWHWILGLIAVATLTAPPLWAAGSHVVVRVDEPFEVNGELFQPGRLSLRPLSPLSPVAMLSEMRVDDRSLGLVLARSGSAKEIATRDEVIFERGADGQLVLVSVALRGEPVRKLYRLGATDDGATGWRAVSTTRASLMAP